MKYIIYNINNYEIFNKIIKDFRNIYLNKMKLIQ